MAKNKITITGTIGVWESSSYWFKYLLDECDKGPVTVSVNSYGGDVNEAIAIGNMIKDHGDITVEYIAYNASAATLLGVYAKKVIIRADALFMIHKTSVWVDAWGQMNEDQIDTVITELKAKKDLASASTLQIAKIYATKSSKSVGEILQMMKDARWMSPEEALEVGLVDEIIPVKEAKKASAKTAALFKANGMDLPVNYIESASHEEETPINKIRNILGLNKHNKTKMESKFTIINSLLGIEGVEVNDNVVALTVEQIQKINDRLDELQSQIAGFKCVEKLDDLDASVAEAKSLDDKIKAVTALVEHKPAGKASDETGEDKHDMDVEGYEPDPVNNYFE